MSSPRSLLCLLLLAACAAEPPVAPIAPAPTAAPPPPIAEPPPPATADPAPPASASAPLGKIDPADMKEYRADVCYYGTFALRLAREEYLAAVGKGRPGPGHVPWVPDGSPAPPPQLVSRPNLERTGKACTAGVALADLAVPGFERADPALAALAPVAVAMSKALTEARTYYLRGDHLKDGFARGQALHDELAAAFGQLDAPHERLGAALDAHRKAKPPSAKSEGERRVRAAIEDARDVFTAALAPSVRASALAPRLGKLEKAVKELESALDSADPWVKIAFGPFASYLKSAAPLLPPATPDAEARLRVVADFVGIIEARQRAIARAAWTSANP